MSHKFLIVDDEESIRFTFKAFLSDEGYAVDTAETLAEAMEMVGENSYDAVFLDILLGRESGLKVLAESREHQPNTPVIMVTGAPEVRTAAESLRLGAFDYITKPLHQDELLRQARLAIAHKALVDERETYQLRMAAVFQSVQEGILIWDEDMRLVEINDAAAKMLGRDVCLLGLTPGELGRRCPPFKLMQEMIEQRCAGEIFHMETTNGTGQPLAVGLTMAPLTGHGQRELGTVLVLRGEKLPVRQVEA